MRSWVAWRMHGRNRENKGMTAYQEAIGIIPNNAFAHCNLGNGFAIPLSWRVVSDPEAILQRPLAIR